jgi:CRISPR-associated protein Cmr6
LGLVRTWGARGEVMAKKKERNAGLQGLQALQLLKADLPELMDTAQEEQVGFPQLVKSPLQELKLCHFEIDGKDRELPESIFNQAIMAEENLAPLYEYLGQRIKQLADVTLTVVFPWRLRVGGLPGFRDLLLPAMHPVYGVPYVPASSIKGVVRAWAKQQDDAIKGQVNDVFGYIDGNSKDDPGSIGKVQFFDAFPSAKCLDKDMANPQWHWSEQGVTYDPQPHVLLSLQNTTLTIGLKTTGRGTPTDVKLVEKWLREALKLGIGSRVSAGYGRSRGQINSPLTSEHSFELWSQGMYGATPPMKANGYKKEDVEFRPSAIRGVLRYWFRAIGLGLYDAETVKMLEGKLFGTIQPTAVRGSLRISIDAEEKSYDPLHVSGKIRLETSSEEDLKFAQALLSVAFSLSGFGRGSRRPLHWNTNQLRGCHGELGDTPMAMDRVPWRQMLEDARSALKILVEDDEELKPNAPSIYRIQDRTQDVLNESAHIYLLKCGKVKHPKVVKSDEWRSIGSSYHVTGEGLQLLYSSGDYKGRSSDRDGLKPGNPNVGGAVNREDGSIPSYILIKSIFPAVGDPYQVVTVFDVDGHADRAAFANAIKGKGGLKVWPLTP